MDSKLSRSPTDGPFRLIASTGAKSRPDIDATHSCRYVAQLMALTHNTIFRALNMVYHWASLVDPGSKQAADLLQYSAIVCRFIHIHHTIEEEIFFPDIETASGVAGLMERNVEQHRDFENGLTMLQLYAENGGCLDAKVLRNVIDGFAPQLERHLHNEIASILDLHDKIDSGDLANIYHRMHAAASRRSNKIQTAPIVMGSQDNSFLIDDTRIRFPDVPVIANVLVDWVVSLPHRSLWHFNWSDTYGNPRPRSEKKNTETVSTTESCGPELRRHILAILRVLGCFLMVVVVLNACLLR